MTYYFWGKLRQNLITEERHINFTRICEILLRFILFARRKFNADSLGQC